MAENPVRNAIVGVITDQLLHGVPVGSPQSVSRLVATVEGMCTAAREALARIADLHANTSIEGGGMTGFCCECDHIWPCPTYHLAMGWGEDSFYDCEDAGWCAHAGVKM